MVYPFGSSLYMVDIGRPKTPPIENAMPFGFTQYTFIHVTRVKCKRSQLSEDVNEGVFERVLIKQKHGHWIDRKPDGIKP